MLIQLFFFTDLHLPALELSKKSHSHRQISAGGKRGRKYYITALLLRYYYTTVGCRTISGTRGKKDDDHCYYTVWQEGPKKGLFSYGPGERGGSQEKKGSSVHSLIRPLGWIRLYLGDCFLKQQRCKNGGGGRGIIKYMEKYYR